MFGLYKKKTKILIKWLEYLCYDALKNQKCRSLAFLYIYFSTMKDFNLKLKFRHIASIPTSSFSIKYIYKFRSKLQYIKHRTQFIFVIGRLL